MKKTIIFTGLLLILALSVVSAIADAPTEGDAMYNKKVIAALQENGSDNGTAPKIQPRMAEVKPTLYQGQPRVIKENGQIMFRNSQTKVNCTDCNFTESDGEIRAIMSNGRHALIKIMPETASEKALERLQLKVCNETANCTIELKEVGQGNDTKMAYEVKAMKQGKFLGIFKAKREVITEVDAETGEILKTKKPWWMSLAKDKVAEEETEVEESENETEENSTA